MLVSVDLNNVLPQYSAFPGNPFFGNGQGYTPSAMIDDEIVILARHPDGTVETVTVERIDEIDDLIARPGTLVWVSVTAPSDELITDLAREFGIHALAVEDLRKRNQRPKLDSYEDQYVLVAYEAVPGEPTILSELHLFFAKQWVVSVRFGPMPMVDASLRRFAEGSPAKPVTVDALIYLVLDGAVDSYFPELDRLSERIEALEDRVLAGDADRRSLGELIELKRRLLELRRVLAPMRDLANSLMRRDIDIVSDTALPYYQDLYDHLVRVLDQVDLYRDLLATVVDARMTVASNSLSQIMKRLTAFTVILMVPTLIAGIYGMNFEYMPELTWPLGYAFALALMAGAVLVAVTWFRRNGWF
jgi:magnesium transporter